jgi:hypothetical protein
LFLLSSAVSAGPIERLTLAASPVSSFAPANLVVRVHVAPDPANRSLEVIAESSDYFRSSRMQLDGEDAPKTITLEFRGLPQGDYAVRGRLIAAPGMIAPSCAGRCSSWDRRAVRNTGFEGW